MYIDCVEHVRHPINNTLTQRKQDRREHRTPPTKSHTGRAQRPPQRCGYRALGNTLPTPWYIPRCLTHRWQGKPPVAATSTFVRQQVDKLSVREVRGGLHEDEVGATRVRPTIVNHMRVSTAYRKANIHPI